MKVSINWHTEDVFEANKMRAPEYQVELTDREANAVLLLACKSEHDAETGVNWDTLKYWIDYVKEHPDSVDRVYENYGEHLKEES